MMVLLEGIELSTSPLPREASGILEPKEWLISASF
jgi:hypothetical protein